MPRDDTSSTGAAHEGPGKTTAAEASYQANDPTQWATLPRKVREALDTLIDLITPVDYPPDNINVATGTTDAGDVNSLLTANDADSLDVSEVGGVPGFNIEINYVDVLETPNRLDFFMYYDGSAGHIVNVQIYDQVGLAWDTIGAVPDLGAAFVYMTYEIINGSKYVKGDNTVETRIYHTNAGNAAHDISIDYCQLRKMPLGGGGGVTEETNKEVHIPMFATSEPKSFDSTGWT